MKRLLAVAASGGLVGVAGLGLAGGQVAQACPNHSPFGWNGGQHAPFAQEVPGSGWHVYASGDPSGGAPDGTSGYVGIAGPVPVLGDGYIEAGGNATDPASGYAVGGNADHEEYGVGNGQVC